MLPFTYTIDGFRALMNGASVGDFETGFAVLGVYAVASVMLALVLFPAALKLEAVRESQAE